MWHGASPMSPAAHLALINTLVGDIQGGLGPFLATWLPGAAEWSPARVGFVSTIVGLATLCLSGPFGILVDQFGRPRLLLVAACGAIFLGTLAILPSRSLPAVLAAQFVAAAGGTLLVPALVALTLGIVGKRGFPRQQGRNQAFNHLGVVAAALLIEWGTPRFGPAMPFWILSAMAIGAIAAVVTTPAGVWNGRRALGWKEDEPNDAKHRDSFWTVFANRRLLALSVALALFNLGNGSMLALLGQKLVSIGGTEQSRDGVIPLWAPGDPPASASALAVASLVNADTPFRPSISNVDRV